MKKSVLASVISEALKIAKSQTQKIYMRKLDNSPVRAAIDNARPPKWMNARRVNTPNGGVYYLNEDSRDAVIIYLHGGAYVHGFSIPHWNFIRKLIKRSGAAVIAPDYLGVPNGTYKEAYKLLIPLYIKCAASRRKLIVMGDSAGGGLALGLVEMIKKKNVRLPDELILISPWLDVSLENKEIKQFDKIDPWLAIEPSRERGKHWAGDLDIHDPKISPIYGKYQDLSHITVFTGTNEIMYPDIVGFFNGLDKDNDNQLVIGENMNHIYVLYPIPEAKPAVDLIISKIKS